MKKLALIGLLSLISNLSFADNCSNDAKAVAKMNLDQVAGKIGFESSDIDAAKFVKKQKVKITEKVSETLTVYSVPGHIYRADYTVTITLDESCAVRTLTIHDDSVN